MKVNFAFVLIFLFSCLGLNVFAQQHKIDSLTKILQSKNDDSSKVSVLHQLYQLTDSLTYAKSELELSEKIGYKSGIALGNLNIGRWYYFDGEEDVALNYLGKSIAVADKNVDKTILSDAYRYLGFIYRPHEPYKALEYYNKSLSLCTETKSDLSASYDLSAIGNVYEGSFELSASNYKKALDYYLH